MSSSLNRLPKGLVCYVEAPGQRRSPLITYKGDGLFDVPDGSAESPGSSREMINIHHVMGWYVKHVLVLNARERWLLEGENYWRPLDCIFVDRGDHALPIYPADQPLSVVLTFSAEEMIGVGEWEESLFHPRTAAATVVEPVVEPVDPPAAAAAAAAAPEPLDRAFLSHLPRGLALYFQEGASPVMDLRLYNAPWGHPKDNLFFDFASLGSGLYREDYVREQYRLKHSVLRTGKRDLECIFVSSGKYEGECLASLALLPAEELARVGEPQAKSISLRVSRMKLLPKGLKLFAVINGRIETGFDFTEFQLHYGTGPVLGYRHLLTKRKASLKEGPDLLASVFNLPDYEEPPGTWGISAFWVDGGNFKNMCLMDLLDWLDDEHLPTVGLETPSEDPLVAARARLEAELALIQAELDKKHSEIAAIEAVQRTKIELLEAERKMAVSRKERDLAERRALGLTPY